MICGYGAVVILGLSFWEKWNSVEFAEQNVRFKQFLWTVAMLLSLVVVGVVTCLEAKKLK